MLSLAGSFDTNTSSFLPNFLRFRNVSHQSLEDFISHNLQKTSIKLLANTMLSMTSLPKSILKASSATLKDTPQPPTFSREEHNRQLALHHARLLQDRKDIESQILASIENLLDFPSSSNASPSDPSSADAATVTEALKPFQPSDYEALIEERNINHRCGYVLCPRGNISQNTNGRYRILTGKKTDFRVVETKELEKWCSDECGKMAVYLRVQLNKEPAWTRDWSAGDLLTLYKERVDHEGADATSHTSRKSGSSDADDETKSRLTALAIERGQKGESDKVSTKLAIRVKDNIKREESPVPPSIENHEGDAIEGYIPRGEHIPKQTSGQVENVDDLMPMGI